MIAQRQNKGSGLVVKHTTLVILARTKRNIQAWNKFAFKLFVYEQWDVIAERVENGDQTWRWVKEQIMEGLRVVEREGRCFAACA